MAKRLSPERQNRVWIELERPSASWPDRHAIGHARAKAASNMLRRLMKPEDVERYAQADPVFWNEDKYRYCFVLDSSGAYVEAGDDGHWFSLDYYGRD